MLTRQFLFCRLMELNQHVNNMLNVINMNVLTFPSCYYMKRVEESGVKILVYPKCSQFPVVYVWKISGMGEDR